MKRPDASARRAVRPPRKDSALHPLDHNRFPLDLFWQADIEEILEHSESIVHGSTVEGAANNASGDARKPGLFARASFQPDVQGHELALDDPMFRGASKNALLMAQP